MKKYTDAELLSMDEHQLRSIVKSLAAQVSDLTRGNLSRCTLASYLRINAQTLDQYRVTARGFPKPKKIGSKLIWRQKVIDAYIDKLAAA